MLKAPSSPLMLWGLLPEIAAQIIRNGGDYILALKANQGNLYKGVKTFLAQAIAKDWQGIDYSYSETTEAGHHPIEHRSFWGVPISKRAEFAQPQEVERLNQHCHGSSSTYSHRIKKPNRCPTILPV